MPSGFGFTHHSIAILYHQVPIRTIRTLFIAVRWSSLRLTLRVCEAGPLWSPSPSRGIPPEGLWAGAEWVVGARLGMGGYRRGRRRRKGGSHAAATVCGCSASSSCAAQWTPWALGPPSPLHPPRRVNSSSIHWRPEYTAPFPVVRTHAPTGTPWFTTTGTHVVHHFRYEHVGESTPFAPR